MENSSDTDAPDDLKKNRWLLWTTIALGIPLLPFMILGELPGERWLSAGDDSAWKLATLGALLMASDTLLPVPSSILGTLLGFRLGWSMGFLASWIGLNLGCAIGYGLGFLLSMKTSVSLPTRPAIGLLIATRPVPVLAEAMLVTAGASRMPILTFGLASAFSNGIVAWVYAGAGARLLPSGWAGPGLIVPMGLPVLAWGLWRWRKRTSVDKPTA